MAIEWQFAGSAKEGEAFEIRGVDVWGQGWQVAAGEEAQVNDPVYGQSYIFRIFHIQDDDGQIEFAAGKLSPGVWGFYTRPQAYIHISKDVPLKVHDLFPKLIHSRLNLISFLS